MTFTAGTEIEATEIHFFGETVDESEALLLVGAVAVQENDAGVIWVLLVFDEGGVEDFAELVGGFEVNMLQMGVFGEFGD